MSDYITIGLLGKILDPPRFLKMRQARTYDWVTMARLHQEGMRLVIADIVRGQLKEGDLLPREADLAEMHDVSRGVARETIRGLEERGLVRVKHGRGAIVTSPGEWDVFDPDVLSALLRSDASTSVLREYLETRRVLEIEAAGLAAERATEEDLQRLSRAFDEMRESADRARQNPEAEAQYREADIGFHRAIVLATDNRVLARMSEPIHRALAAALGPLGRPELRLERGIPEHERIMRAIAGGDSAGARNAMSDHLATVQGYLDEYSARTEPSGTESEVAKRQGSSDLGSAVGAD